MDLQGDKQSKMRQLAAHWHAKVPGKFGPGISKPISRWIAGFESTKTTGGPGDISPKATRTGLILSCEAETKFQISKVMSNLDVFELQRLGPKK